MAEPKYSIGYIYENQYGRFKITDIERSGSRWIYVVVCLKCGHIMRKKSQEIKTARKCLGCVRFMEYSLYNVGDVVNGLKILQKIPITNKHGHINKEYICECVVDGNVVQIREAHLKNGVECMKCAAKKRGELQRKSHEKYVEEMAIKNPFIKIIGTYVDQNTKIKYMCKICEHKGESLPNNLLRGGGCPVCNMSNGEKVVMKYLTDHNMEFKHNYMFQDCRNILPLPFDFYLPELHMCIEYDGEQHYSPINYFGGKEKFEKQQQNDLIKDEYCKNNNINLCRIRYDQNVENVLNEYISSIIKQAVV